jgi:hypothetical protein
MYGVYAAFFQGFFTIMYGEYIHGSRQPYVHPFHALQARTKHAPRCIHHNNPASLVLPFKFPPVFPASYQSSQPPTFLPDFHASCTGLGHNRPLWLAAHTQPGEEDAVGAAHVGLAQAHPGLCTVILPADASRCR